MARLLATQEPHVIPWPLAETASAAEGLREVAAIGSGGQGDRQSRHGARQRWEQAGRGAVGVEAAQQLAQQRLGVGERRGRGPHGDEKVLRSSEDLKASMPNRYRI